MKGVVYDDMKKIAFKDLLTNAIQIVMGLIGIGIVMMVIFIFKPTYIINFIKILVKPSEIIFLISLSVTFLMIISLIFTKYGDSKLNSIILSIVKYNVYILLITLFIMAFYNMLMGEYITY